MSNAAVKMSVQPGYVLVERPQNFDVIMEEQPAQLQELSEFCEDAGCRNVLILGQGTKVHLEALDVHDLGRQIAKLHLHIAMVESHDATDEDVYFLESVALTRGSPIRFFDTESEARHWLGVS